RLGGRQRPAHGGGGGDGRVDDPRAHGGDRDAVRPELVAERLGEAEDGELGRAVGGELGGGEEAGGRGDVYHVTAAAASHHGREGGDRGRGRPEPRLVQVADGEVGAGGREGERGRAPDAARRAGDERRLPVEPHGTPPRKSSTARLKISGVSKLKPWLPPGTFT